MKVAIVKYNAGNIYSVVNAMRRLGVEPIITDDAEVLASADRVLFPGQGEEFVRHPAVRPSILAKNNGLVYDFLLDTKKTGQEMCVILDTPCADKKTVAEYFCYSINSGGYHNIQFSFDGVMETSRVILKGDAAEVLRLVNEYNSKYPIK